MVGGALAAGIVRVEMARCRAVVWSNSEETGVAPGAASSGSALPATLGIDCRSRRSRSGAASALPRTFVSAVTMPPAVVIGAA